MRLDWTSLLLIPYLVDAVTEEEIFAMNFCKAALSSDLAFCDYGVGECSIRSSYAHQRVIRGESRIPCTLVFLQQMEARFQRTVKSIFSSSREKSFARVDGANPVPMRDIFSSYSRFLRVDLSRLLIPSEILDDSARIVKLIEMRVFCPTSTWFSPANLPLRYEDLDRFLLRVMDEPVLPDSVWKEINRIAPKGRPPLPPLLAREIGQYLGPTMRSEKLLTDESRFQLLTGRASPRLMYMAHNIVSRLIRDTRIECTLAFTVACTHRVLGWFGVPDRLGGETLSVLSMKGDYFRQIEQAVPAGQLRWLYHLVSYSNIGELIGATKRELLSHHMLISLYPNQRFLSDSIDQAIGPIDHSLPTPDEVIDLIRSIPTINTVKRCVLETLIRYVAKESGVGPIQQIHCQTTTLSASSVFAAIDDYMHNTTLESFRTFHRMFRSLPIMSLFQTALEQVGYQQGSTPTPFVDPRMKAVYDAFIAACTSLETTAKQYHIMFGRRDSFGW
jgi:hypothetical protein